MPLIQSGESSAIKTNIREMIRAGHSRAQAVAAALRTADEYGRGRAAGGSTGASSPTVPTYGTAGNGSPGILPSGLMAVPQVGNYTIDTNTGALSPATQAALTSFAMRGLPPASTAPGYAIPASIAPPAPVEDGSASNAGQLSIGGNNRGGRIRRRAVGGPIGSLDSMATRSAFHSIDHPSGLVHGFGAGRTDTVPMSVAAGSHVIPADVISGLGEGNTLAGAHAMGMAMKTGPGGITLPSGPHRAMGTPKMPSYSAMQGLSSPHLADGGDPSFEGHAIKVAKGGCPGGVKCIVAGGEWIMTPDEVRRTGHKGKKSHEAVDAWIMERRGADVKKLKALPGPVGMKK